MISSIGEGFFLISFQMSMVKIVDEELKMEVKEDMRAANITASIIPLRPEMVQKKWYKGHPSMTSHVAPGVYKGRPTTQ